VELARRVGLGERLHGTSPAVRGSYILSGTRLRRMPEGMTGLVPSRFMPFVVTSLLSPWGKLRVGMEYFIPVRADDADESIEQFVTRRLGREMYERLVEPLLSGISAGNGARLSMEAMFPQLRNYEREYGGLIRGMLVKKRESANAGQERRNANTAQDKNGAGQERRRTGTASEEEGVETARERPPLGGFLSFPNGLGELVEAIQREIRRRDAAGTRAVIRTGARVERIEQRETAQGPYDIVLTDGERVPADAVITATPGYISAAALNGVDEALAALLRGIEYASTVTVSVAYPAGAVPRALDATGYVTPRALGRDVLACTWVSSKFDGRAPEGHALFRLFMGGAGRGSFVERPDADLLDVVRREMRQIMGITAEPELARINRFDRAMPQYNVGHLERVAQIEALASRHAGLALAGAASGGVGIPDCVRSGERAARTVLDALGPLATTESESTT
jgi:protoporphyrinogen/coproporphyrinogen III oxidase